MGEYRMVRWRFTIIVLSLLLFASGYVIGRQADPRIYIVEPVTPATSAPAVPYTSTTGTAP